MRLCRLWLPVLVLSCLSGALAAQAQPLQWRRAAPDLEIATMPLATQAIFSSELLLFRTRLRRFRAGTVRASEFGLPRSDVRTLCRLSRAVLCINANFFDEHGKPLGLVVSRGITHQPLHRGGKTLTGVLVVDRSGVSILQRADYDPRSALEAMQAGPRLIAERRPVPLAEERSPAAKRSVVCVDGADRLIIAVSTGLIGCSIRLVQEALRQPGADCVEALNLDGGGSSQLYLSGAVPGAGADLQELFVAGSDDIPVALALFVK